MDICILTKNNGQRTALRLRTGVFFSNLHTEDTGYEVTTAFLRHKSGRGRRLTTHSHLTRSLRMHGAITPIPGVVLNHRQDSTVDLPRPGHTPSTFLNPLAPNDVYISRTAQLTFRRCILNIYSTNILTEYFKHAAHSPFFFSSTCRLFHNAAFFWFL